MKITNIKVNSYGNIQNRQIKFTDGINIIKGKNESGKSTLLSYIINILYGISKNKEGKSLSDYEKYKPWTGDEFSGKIQYSLDSGEKYEVYRDFNKKNPQIYNEKYEEISDKYNVNKKEGNQFFNMQTNIDKQMYLSTVVATQQEVRLDEKSQNMLVQKIANLAGTGEDNVSYKKAVTKLQEKIRDEIGTNKTSLKPINIAQNELNNIEIELKKIQPYEDEKYNIDARKEKIKEKIEQLENKRQLAIETKKIYEKQNESTQKIEIKKKSIKENTENLNILLSKEKIYEANKLNILNNIKDANELKCTKQNELENLIKKEAKIEEDKKIDIQKAKNTGFIIIEAILAIILIISIISIKNKIFTMSIIAIMLAILGVQILKIIKIKNNNARLEEKAKEEQIKNISEIKKDQENIQCKIEEITNDIENIKKELEKCNEELSMLKGQITLLNKNINDDSNEIEQTSKKMEDEIKEKKYELLQKYKNKINIDEITDIIKTEDIYEKSLKVENDFNNSLLNLRTLEIEEKNILSQLDNIITLKEKQSIIKERIRDLKQKEEIINLALENLQEAYEEMKTTITPKFTRNLSNNVSKISSNKYTKVTINDEKGMIVESQKGEYIEACKLSVGTIDQLYLSLRLSMVDELSKEKLPIILDETFAYFDEERMENALKYILDELKKHQTIIFTCSNREIETLKKLNVQYNLIEL